jgi:uncharacterized membrane protein YfcA
LVFIDYVLIGFTAFISSLVSGFGGFGGGFIIVLVMTPLVGVKAVIPLVSVMAFFGNLGRIYFYRKTIEWKIAIHFILASSPGVALGTNFFAWLPEKPLLGLLGAILIAIVPIRRYLKKYNIKPGIKTVLAIGFLFGLISGTAVGSGMFVIAGLTSMGIHGPLLLGTDAMIGAVNAASRLFSFWSLGILSFDFFLAGVLMGAMTLPGTWLASRMVHRMGIKRHTQFIEGLIIIGGLVFIYEALFGTVST